MECKASSEHSIRFARLILELYGHEKVIEFDVMTLDFDEVRLVLEAGGYSVHRDPHKKQTVIAYRVETDRAPIVLGSASHSDRRFALR